MRKTVQKLTFYFPIAVGGPLQAIIDGYCKGFQQETGIAVEAVYAGTYSDTLVKAMTAIKAGTGPQFAVLLAAQMHSLQDEDILVSLDEIGLDADAKKWLDGFYPAFMANSHADGKTWSVPFQRSTAIFYYNKDAFRDAGLDPEKFPTTWADLEAAAEKLTKRDASGRVTRWGVKMAGDLGNAQWTFGALANQAEQKLMNEAGTEVYFNQPKTIEAMAFWRGLASQYHATPDGVINWGDLTPDFLQGNTAIIQFTTGGLPNFRDKATFPFGVAGLAGKNSPHTVVGGGNMYFFKSASPAERQASLRFARWVSAPERAADWSIKTGYIATSAGGLRHASAEGLHREISRGQCGAHIPAGGDRRIVGAREPARLQGADRQHPGLPEWPEDAGQGDGGHAGRVGSDPEAVQEGLKGGRRACGAKPSTLICCCCPPSFCWWRSPTGRRSPR